MLVPLVISAFVVSSVGLTDFLNDVDEEQASNLSVRNVVIGLAFAGVILMIARLIFKVICYDKEVEGISSTVMQSEKKRSKGKLKRKILESNKGKISKIVKEIESLKLQSNPVAGKEKDELGISDSNSRNVQKVVNGIFVAGEGWINVRKKEREQRRHLRQNGVNGAKGNVKATSYGFSSVDQSFEDTPSVNNMRGGIIIENKESRRSYGLRRSVLKASEKSKTDIGLAPCVSSQKALVGFSNIESSSEKCNNSSATNKNLNISRDTIEEESNLENKYLKQGARPRIYPNSRQYVSCAEKVSAGLPSIGPISKKKDSSPVKDNKHHVTTASNAIDIFSNGFRSELTQPRPLNSELCFKEDTNYSESLTYKRIMIKYCSQLRSFRELHFTYCIKLIKKTFKIQNGKLVISDFAKSLFERLTPHTEEIFFILKIFFLVSFSTLCGGRGKVARMRYCSTHFYNQSLLDLLISEVIMNSSKGGDAIKEIFDIHCKHMCDTGSYEPHSGNFFQKVFNICRSLASVNLPEEKQALVDFAMLACMVYSGHMITMLCRMLIYNNEAESGPLLISECLNARFFGNRCYHLRKSVIHMYHPANGEECPKSVGGVVNVPLMMWRRCSKVIDNIVIEAASQGKMDFGIFVRDIISSSRKLILRPYTAYSYERDIKMYDCKIKTVKSLLPLPHYRTMYADKKSEDSKTL
ncbi:DUF3514 domain-containing protein [Ehrlichia sp. JZT12]